MAKAVKKLTSKSFFTITGSDPKNGVVQLVKGGKCFLLTNTRNGVSKKFSNEQEAIAAYNHQINTSH